jgi:hypothetical protein
VPPDALPDLAVPDAFVDRELGAEEFQPEPEILAEGDDWYLLLTTVDALLPVPAGWAVNLRVDAVDMVLGALDDGGVEAFVQRFPSGTDLAELIADIESDVDPTRGDAIFLLEAVDADRAYFSGASLNDEVLTVGIAVLSRDGNGQLLLLSAATEASQWAEFEPVFRAMMAGWYDLAGNPLGFELPDDLGIPSVGAPISTECVALVGAALDLIQGVLDEVSDVTVEEFEAAGEDAEAFIDLPAFEAASDDIGVRTIEQGCIDNDLGLVLEARLGELDPDGDVPELVLAQLVESDFNE